MGVQAHPAAENAAGADGFLDLAALERAMLKAHESHDHSGLVVLYRQAAEIRFSENNVDAGCFYLTHAYVFALETGHAMQDEIRDMLAVHGREPKA